MFYTGLWHFEDSHLETTLNTRDQAQEKSREVLQCPIERPLC